MQSLKLIFTTVLLLILCRILSAQNPPVLDLGGEDVAVNDAPKPAFLISVGSPEWLAAINSLDSLNIAPSFIESIKYGHLYTVTNTPGEIRRYDKLGLFIYLEDILKLEHRIRYTTRRRRSRAGGRVNQGETVTMQSNTNAALQTVRMTASAPVDPQKTYPDIQQYFYGMSGLKMNSSYDSATDANYTSRGGEAKYVNLKRLYDLGFLDNRNGNIPADANEYFFNPVRFTVPKKIEEYSRNLFNMLDEEIERQARRANRSENRVQSARQGEEAQIEAASSGLNTTPLSYETQIYLGEMAIEIEEIISPMRVKLRQLKPMYANSFDLLSEEEKQLYSALIINAEQMLLPIETLLWQVETLANTSRTQTSYTQLSSIVPTLQKCHRSTSTIQWENEMTILTRQITQMYCSKVRGLERRYNDLRTNRN